MELTPQDAPDAPALRPHDIIPVHLAIKAMRDNGYKNAAYALAELMDNSIQAGLNRTDGETTRVDLLVAERETRVGKQRRMRIEELAVLDNGCGMDAATLRLALQFGNGTRLDTAKHDGIGRFGMGLPSASISQCTRVDVWSWKSGVAGALHTHLDLDEIASGRMSEVPAPLPKPVPVQWKCATRKWGQSGTLVVWSGLDRLTWKESGALFKNSERIVGRMYRRFIADESVVVRFVAFDAAHPAEKGSEQLALPNDPGYLMPRTSCPGPFDHSAMFAPHHGCQVIGVPFRGETHQVTITVSVAREEARVPYGRNPGSTPHGKHAASNVGVSVVRAGRELELDTSWTNGYNPVERWWGVEIAFPPALDELFGVTNNKQAANALHKVSNADLFDGGEFDAAAAAEMDNEGSSAKAILDISKHVQKAISAMRNELDQQKKIIERAADRKDKAAAAVDGLAGTPEGHATAVTQQRQEDGHHGESDAGEAASDADKQREIEAYAVAQGVPAQIAHDKAVDIVVNRKKFEFIEVRLDSSSAFFSVEMRSGVLLVKLNTEHPAYDRLIEALDANADIGDPAERLARARDGLRLLLYAWARYEDETQGRQRERLQDIRNGWGVMAREFMRASDDD